VAVVDMPHFSLRVKCLRTVVAVANASDATHNTIAPVRSHAAAGTDTASPVPAAT